MPQHAAWVVPQPKKTLVVGVADSIASNDPSAELVTYSLGSCLGVAIYDPVRKCGGLLHVMLPDSKINPTKAAAEPYVFVDTALPRLFQAFCSLGGDRGRVVIKIAGGAQFLDPQKLFNIGERNFVAVSALLARNNYTIHGRDIGGCSSRTMRFSLSTGQVSIHSPAVAAYNL